MSEDTDGKGDEKGTWDAGYNLGRRQAGDDQARIRHDVYNETRKQKERRLNKAEEERAEKTRRHGDESCETGKDLHQEDARKKRKATSTLRVQEPTS